MNTKKRQKKKQLIQALPKKFTKTIFLYVPGITFASIIVIIVTEF